jgi:hypothetical protein
LQKRTKWAWLATALVVGAAIVIICRYGNHEEVTPVQVRDFTMNVCYAAMVIIALVWGCWYYVGKKR